MIQRIQTLYLLISSIIISLLTFSPIASVTIGANEVKETFQFFSFGLKNIGNSTLAINIINPIVIILLVVVIALLGLVTIFLYKKRKLQITLSILNIIITALVIGLVFYFRNILISEHSADFNFYIAFIFPFITIVLLFLAIKGIIKDEKLIKSIDRIR